jgi:hypothetical protein
LKSINDHPEFTDWSVPKGRLDCFERINMYLAKIFKVEEGGNGFLSEGASIKDLVEKLALYELAISGEVPDFLDLN